MMQRMCNGCKKLIRKGDNFIHIEHDNEESMVHYGFVDYSEKDYHNWACVGITVMDETEAQAARQAGVTGGER